MNKILDLIFEDVKNENPNFYFDYYEYFFLLFI